MTTDKAPAPSSMADIGAEFADTSEDVFAREEQFQILKIRELAVEPMPEETMTSRQINWESPEFQAVYGPGPGAMGGFPSLKIGVEGVDVKFAFAADGIKRIWVPLYGDQPDKLGQRRGRRSHAHIITLAFEKVYKVRPFGVDIQNDLLGRVARWGQHLGDMELDGDTIEWAWDIPREAYAADFEYDGPVRTIQGTQDGATPAFGAAQVSEDEGNALVVAAVIGLGVDDTAGASQKVMAVQGLPQEWYSAAADQSVLRLAGERELIHAGDDGKVEAA